MRMTFYYITGMDHGKTWYLSGAGWMNSRKKAIRFSSHRAAQDWWQENGEAHVGTMRNVAVGRI